jgi:rhodanese-related sulfurtransferase
MVSFRNLSFVAAMLVGLAAPALADDAPMQIKGATTVNAQQVVELVSGNADLVILDNRKPEDFSAGHIEGAIRLIDTEVSADTLAQHVSAKDKPVLFYCNGLKCGRAAKASEKAIQLGYSKVYYYALGMEDWNKQGLPLTR